MNNLWIFGDSNSALNTQLKNTTVRYGEYMDIVGDFDVWSEHLAKKINFNLHNHALIGSSNYTIFDTFCSKISKINDGDIVIINWSVNNRFRVGDGHGKFLEILPQWISTDEFKFGEMFKVLTENDLTIEALEMIGANRFSNETLYQNEVNSWSKFIEDYCIIKNVKILFWGICPYQDYFVIDGQKSIEELGGLIYQETNNMINDKHFGKNGHLLFAEKMFNFLNTYK